MTINEIADMIIKENSPIDYGWLRYCAKHSNDMNKINRTPSPRDIFFETAVKSEHCKNPQVAGKVARIIYIRVML